MGRRDATLWESKKGGRVCCYSWGKQLTESVLVKCWDGQTINIPWTICYYTGYGAKTKGIESDYDGGLVHWMKMTEIKL